MYSSAELANVFDCTKLKLPEGTEAFELAPAHADLKTPGLVKQVWPQWLEQFAKLGWKPLGGPQQQVNDEYAFAPLGKDGFLVDFSVAKMGDKPESMVSIFYHGNLDARKLPRTASGVAVYETQAACGYRTTRSVDDEFKVVLKVLTADGWTQYHKKDGSDFVPNKENQFASLMKRGYRLDLMVSVAPNENGKTHVQYNVYALSHEIPLPKEATNIKFDDDRWELQCQAPGDFQSVAKQYQTLMADLGCKPLPSEKPEEKYWNQRFGDDAGDILLVQTSLKDDHTGVLFTGIPAAVVKEMEKRDREAEEKAKKKSEQTPKQE